MQAQVLQPCYQLFLAKEWPQLSYVGDFLTMWPSFSPQDLATSEITLGVKSTWKEFHRFGCLQAGSAVAGRSHQQLLTHLCLSELCPFFTMLRNWNRMETEQRCSLSTRSSMAELLQAAKETVTNVRQISAASLSRLQSKVELYQGAFPLLEMTDVPHIDRDQPRTLLWAGLSDIQWVPSCNLLCKWFVLFLCSAQKHLNLFHHLPVCPATLYLYKTTSCHSTWVTLVQNWQGKRSPIRLER